MVFHSEVWFLLELMFISLLLVFVAPFMLHLGTGLIPGINSFTVTTGSMEPNISTGSIIYTHRIANFSTVQKGDVITFEEGDQYVTHRVYDIRKEARSTFFITKGDENDEPDSEPVEEARVIGRVFLTVPLIGKLVKTLSSREGLLLFVILPTSLIIVIEIKNIRRALLVKN